MLKNCNKKTAIVLFNLGGPDGLEAVRPFLFNLFNDKNIIALPSYLRIVLAYLISLLRHKKTQAIYSKMGGKSTILAETTSQAQALQDYLKHNAQEGTDCRIFICMRHWHPMSLQVIEEIESYDPQEIILLPLYPQFSTTTTLSAIEDFKVAQNKSIIKHITCKIVCCYPQGDGFIKAHAHLLSKAIMQLKIKTGHEMNSGYIVLFSAHGLPQKIIDAGDPYQSQVELSVKKIIDEMSIKNFEYKITYQSKVGLLKWTEPNTEDAIKKAAAHGLAIVVVPISFVSEHSETLVELDIDYRKIASKAKVEYCRVKTLSIDKLFIKFLGETVLGMMAKEGKCICPSNHKKICWQNFTKCPYQMSC